MNLVDDYNLVSGDKLALRNITLIILSLELRWRSMTHFFNLYSF